MKIAQCKYCKVPLSVQTILESRGVFFVMCRGCGQRSETMNSEAEAIREWNFLNPEPNANYGVVNE